MTKNQQRLWEIDFLRGIAIIMMIVFHFMFDLAFFNIYSVNISTGFWWVFARITAIIFIFLVGISLTLSHSRIKERLTSKRVTIKYLKRGTRIFLYGLIITAITWVFLGNGFIVFGILHFIGIAIILSRQFLKHEKMNLILGSLFICVGIYLQTLTFDFPWLFWLGFKPAMFYTLDYFPLLPWFGFVLIGIFFGKIIYSTNKPRTRPISMPVINQFCYLGRHSLIIYLLHQPILIAVLYAVGLI